MKNFETFTEEIKKQLLNVKIMNNTDFRYKKYYNMTEEERHGEFITLYDPTKDKSYFKIVEFKYGYEYKGGCTFHIMCEVHSWKKPELQEMKMEIYEDGEYVISGVYISFEYWGKIDM